MNPKELVWMLGRKPDLGASCRNWHARGIDYLCLHRSEELTVKLYHFGPEIEPNALGAVVWPHSHRYSFQNMTLMGCITNVVYEGARGPSNWDRLNYWPKAPPVREGSVCLREIGRSAAPEWRMSPRDIHTVVVEPGSLCLQLQFADEVPEESPSSLYVPKGLSLEVDVTRLYGVMTAERADEILHVARKAVG